MAAIDFKNGLVSLNLVIVSPSIGWRFTLFELVTGEALGASLTE